MRILVINGPNLNLLGQRDPALYGTATLDDLYQLLTREAEALGVQVSFFQSNHEGEIIDVIQEARETADALIINPGGLAHTSVILRDALADFPHPAIEVHLSNIYAREGFRHHSYISAVVTGVISGLGMDGYRLALNTLARRK